MLTTADQQTSNCHLGVAYRPNHPVTGCRIFQGDRWLCGFSGDLIDHKSVPFDKIISVFESQDFEQFALFEGIFCVVAIDKIRNVIHVVTDRRGQKPVFCERFNGTIAISSHLATFTRLQHKPRFDEKWLWQSMFFNFTVDSTTFLKNVKRLPAATVMSFDAESGKMRKDTYADLFRQKFPLLSGSEALEVAATAFAERVPAHYSGADQYACALTGGWDGRTMLALAPKDVAITAYTYGCADSNDIKGGADAARLANIRHIPVEFGKDLVNDLPKLALDTVHLSSGMQGILRSTLLYAYRKVSDDGKRFPVTLSGIALDMLFRGHAHRPNLISNEMAQLFDGSTGEFQADYWRSIFGAALNDFRQSTDETLANLNERFGNFTETNHHLSYAVYPLSTNHFCGEMMISDHFTTVRVPSWDSRIVDLAYSIENSTLCYSQFLKDHVRGSRKELILQAYLLKKLSPYFFAIPVSGRSPAGVLAGELPYRVQRIKHAIIKRIKNRSTRNIDGALEDWDSWLFESNRDFLDDLFRAPDCRVSNYVSRSFIDDALANKNQRFVGKLATAEIILRLVENRWAKFW